MSRFFDPAVLFAIVLVSPAAADAQFLVSPTGTPVEKKPKPTIVPLAVDAAPEPRPALKYGFIPRSIERKSGNAASYYYRALLAFNAYQAHVDPKTGKSLGLQIDAWSHAPLEMLRTGEARAAIGGFSRYDDLREAAYREECNWDWRVQDLEGTKSVEFLLSEVQESRGLARWLAAKARLEIAEGRYDDAIETLRVGYQLAQDVAKPPFLISGLVGIAIRTILNEQVNALIAAPGSPNLYWAFSELPRPSIDLGPAVEFELTLPFRVFPVLKDPEHAEHSTEQWADLISRAFHTATHAIEASQERTPYGWPSRLAATAMAVRGYSEAKRELIAAAYDRSKVEQMPVGQVIAIHEALLCHYVADEMRKWTLVPHLEGRQRLKEVERSLIREHYLGPPVDSREIVPVMSLLLPATPAADAAMRRLDASIAAYRVIEAIRMHAAANGGMLPKTLSEITVVPVPPNPRLGTPFPYRLDGGKGVLEVRRVTEPSAPMDEADQVFEITIARDRSR